MNLGPYELDSIIVGDCLEIMRNMPDGCVDAVITDPPYAGLSGGVSNPWGGVAEVTAASVTIGSPWGNDLSALNHFARIARSGALVFCSWHCVDEVVTLLGGTRIALLTWYKRNSQPSLRNRPHYRTEFIWAIEYGQGMNWKVLDTHYDIASLPAGCMGHERILRHDSAHAAHPTQKPIALLSALTRAVPEDGLIFDPFMGTGTTAVAAKKLGRHYFGCDINPDYVRMANERVAKIQGVQLELDTTARPAAISQPGLLGVKQDV